MWLHLPSPFSGSAVSCAMAMLIFSTRSHARCRSGEAQPATTSLPSNYSQAGSMLSTRGADMQSLNQIFFNQESRVTMVQTRQQILSKILRLRRLSSLPKVAQHLASRPDDPRSCNPCLRAKADQSASNKPLRLTP